MVGVQRSLVARPKLYITSTINIWIMFWQIKLILCALAFFLLQKVLSKAKIDIF